MFMADRRKFQNRDFQFWELLSRFLRVYISIYSYIYIYMSVFIYPASPKVAKRRMKSDDSKLCPVCSIWLWNPSLGTNKATECVRVDRSHTHAQTKTHSQQDFLHTDSWHGPTLSRCLLVCQYGFSLPRTRLCIHNPWISNSRSPMN